MAFVAHLGLEPAIDPSNADSRRLRARLRQVVVPELEAILPGAAARAGSLAEEAALASEAIERWLDEALGPRASTSWPRDRFASLPKALRVAGLLRSLRELDPHASRDLPRRTVEAVAAAIDDREVHPRRWAIGSSLEAAVDARSVTLRRRGEEGQEPLDRHGPRHAAT
jgi:tRNA(Ile)-lysidine synthase TilS/MesJ